jgi:transcriptional regulator with XRE-family HTH domain
MLSIGETKVAKLQRNGQGSDQPSTLGDRLTQSMKRMGLKNPEIAAAAGVHPVTVSKWRNDVNPPADAELERVAKLLGVSLVWLRYGDRVIEAGGRATGEAVASARAEQGPPVHPAPGRGGNLPLSVRELLAESRLEMVKAGALDEEIEEALALMRSAAVFTFYEGGAAAPRDFNEADVLKGMRAIYNGAIKPELKQRGRKL